jgi:hypothetical protein
LDFEAGPVWFVAATQWSAMGDVFIPGDKIMVVFTSSKMKQISHTDRTFAG